MKLSLIVAVCENGVIGRDGGLPWRLSSDLRYFKRVTMGSPVIMGRKTFQSVGHALPGRTNIVVSRNEGFAVDGVIRVASLDAALEHARSTGTDEAFVIGGGEIYRQALPLAQCIHLTRVHLEVDGDTTFPDLEPQEWREVSRERHIAGEKDSADFSIVVLERIAGRRAS